jgi:hypothetical protein
MERVASVGRADVASGRRSVLSHGDARTALRNRRYILL